MAKPVQIRASYRDDAAYLLRMEAAVAKDDRQSADWRKETCKQIRDLSQRLLGAKVEDHVVPAPKADDHGRGQPSKKAAASR